MNKTLKVAAAQYAPVFLDKEKTLQKACDIVEDAANRGVELLVFPEAFISGYPDWVWLIPNSRGRDLNSLYAELVENAVSVPDSATETLCKAAKRNGIHLVMGMNERNTESSGASLFNSFLLIDDQGKILGRHRKLIPTGGERLIWGRGDGSTLHAHESRLGKIAGLICWENFMPLARNAIYESGAQILASPTWDKSDNWLLSMRHIAREGGLFVISSCMALAFDDIPNRYEFKKLYPEGREWVNPGNSCIIAPNGQILAGPLEAEEGLVTAEIDLRQIVEAKRMFDVSGHYSRPDVFNFALKNLGT